MIENICWKEFQLDNLGTIQKVKGKPLKEYPLGNIPFVTGSQENNGVVGYVEAPQEAISKGNCIVIDPIKGMCMYHPNDFVGRGFSGASVNALYIDGLTEEVALFIATAIEKYSTKVASYTNLFNSKRLTTAKISLPVVTLPDTTQAVIDETHQYHKDGYIPDWKYMQERIKELEQERIKELEQYLIVTGLNDYELTEEDKEVLVAKLVEGGAITKLDVWRWLLERSDGV